MKKWTYCLLTLALPLLLLPGCQNTEEQTATGSESTGSAVVAEQSTPLEQADPVETPQATPDFDAPINSAVSVIPGVQALADLNGGLFALKEYGPDMGWSEANQLQNLDRGTPYDQVGAYDSYFLLVPRHTGSRVEINRLEYDAQQGPLASETLYLHENTPDSYGVIITSNEPETIPNLSVTVTFGAESHTYIFSYDGRGERPAVQLFDRSGDAAQVTDTSGSDAPPAVEINSFRWTGEGRTLEAQIPAKWSQSDSYWFFSHTIDGRQVDYTVIFYPPETGNLDEILTPEAGDTVHSLPLGDGRTCRYVLERDRPLRYVYALEVEDSIVRVQVNFIEDGPDSESSLPFLLPPTDADDTFLPMLASIRFVG